MVSLLEIEAEHKAVELEKHTLSQEVIMEKKSKKKDMSCSIKCNKEYFECIDKGEHESVCNIQRAQCNCSCK